MSMHVQLRRLFDAIGPPDALASAKLMENKSVVRTSSTLPARARQGLIRTILVPVDFSDCSLAGLTYAIRFAKEVGARIVVVHVADLGPVMMTTGCGDYDSPTYIEAARHRCGDQMKGFLKRVSFDDVPV